MGDQLAKCYTLWMNKSKDKQSWDGRTASANKAKSVIQCAPSRMAATAMENGEWVERGTSVDARMGMIPFVLQLAYIDGVCLLLSRIVIPIVVLFCCANKASRLPSHTLRFCFCFYLTRLGSALKRKCNGHQATHFIKVLALTMRRMSDTVNAKQTVQYTVCCGIRRYTAHGSGY